MGRYDHRHDDAYVPSGHLTDINDGGRSPNQVGLREYTPAPRPTYRGSRASTHLTKGQVGMTSKPFSAA